MTNNAVHPQTESEAAAIIRDAAARRTPVVPFGSGTSQGICRPASTDAIILHTTKLNAVVHHEPGDLVATVQAGMMLATLQEALRAKGQWLPIDGEPESTLGGMLAADRSGPRSYGYGTLRDLVLGMTVINGDGILRKCGGRVVKNVTGYALDKLYIGSMGTLGLFTEATFKLRPLPIAGEAWLISAASLDEAVDLLRLIAALNLPLEMLQVFSRRAIELGTAILTAFPGHEMFHNETPPFALVVCASGAQTELQRMHQELANIAGERLKRLETSSSETPEQTSARAYDVNRALARLGTAERTWLAARNGPGATLRFWSVRSKLKDVLRFIAPSPETPFTCGVQGGAVDLSGLSEALPTQLKSCSANFRFENIAGVAVSEPFGPSRPEWELMRKIRASLDPQGIMNSGRYVV